MEESGLLKERLHAITEKHHIQEHIRQKKDELDQEKLRLQHLKKKSLREQWLLQDSTNLLSDQQQTRELQLNINRIQKEIDSLERKESVISTNESFILNRLKAVEKSPEEIIKEAQNNFIPALFAMEINVTKNMLTGESTVLSTAPVPTEELNQHTGLKVYDDGRKCVYALPSQQGSHDQSRVSELSANEVEQLLKSATEHRQLNQQNYHQNHSRKAGHCFFSHPDENDHGEWYDPRNQRGLYGNSLPRNNTVQRDFSWQSKPLDERLYGHRQSWHEERINQYIGREGHRLGNRNIIRSSSLNIGRTNGYPPPRSHDVVSPYQPQLCYTPANYIPLSDYVCVEEEELYCYSPPPHHSHSHIADNQPTHSDRAPSPLYRDDSAYTILNTMETTEPITAIFMGFQTAEDDSGQVQEYEGSLKAELVIIEDNEEKSKDKNNKGSVHGNPTGSSANGNVGRMEGDGNKLKERPGIKKIRKNHRPCCTLS
ncbi:palmdelphin [Scomber japonicus]|uniref:palmdelphin n=1 Tax=Scomber japonicus TaxID=13676 RepID=UPI002305C0B1|nr:palmdelphin [Scomber japonicus]